jgi:subtilase family serine protease
LSVTPGEPVTVRVNVKNTGTRSGEEVIQLYLSHPASTLSMPVKELKSFKRITLDPDQTVTIEFKLSADELYYYDETSNTYDVEPGQYTVRAGNSSDNLLLSDSFEVRNDTRKPDLLITNVRLVPPYPLPGQKVMFYAAVKNAGTAPATGSQFKLLFSIKGRQVSWSDNFTDSIPAGGMALICGNTGPNGINTWTASAVGTFAIEAFVDANHTLDECVENNNVFSSKFTVYPYPPQNLALHKSVIVSSVRGAGYEGTNAVDGNINTQWRTPSSDPQFITVDLGTEEYISDVVLRWGTLVKEYYLQISDDTLLWQDVNHVMKINSVEDRIFVGAYGRYVRMLGIQRQLTSWGYYLQEMEIYGPPSPGTNTDLRPANFLLNNNYPNPFNPNTVIEFTIGEKGHTTLKVYNILGQEIAILFDQIAIAGKTYQVNFLANGLPSGVYFAVLESGKQRSCKSMVLIK